MHPAAWICAHLFFMMVHYIPTNEIHHEQHGDTTTAPSTPILWNILDIGSADVNGNMRDALFVSALQHYNYTGLDMDSTAPNVDVVVTPGEPATNWPFEPEQFNIIISSSCYEHDDTFWETFATTATYLAKGGLLYVSVPSRTPVHRFPVDNWRFFADSAYALAKWTNRVTFKQQRFHHTKQQQQQQQALTTTDCGDNDVLVSGAVCVLFAATIPGDDDTTMVFWKVPEAGAGAMSPQQQAMLRAQYNELKAYFSLYLHYAVLNMEQYYDYTLDEKRRIAHGFDKAAWDGRTGSAGRLMSVDAAKVAAALPKAEEVGGGPGVMVKIHNRSASQAPAVAGTTPPSEVLALTTLPSMTFYQHVQIPPSIIEKLDCTYTSFPLFRESGGVLHLPVSNYAVRYVEAGPLWLQHEFCFQEMYVVVKESELLALREHSRQQQEQQQQQQQQVHFDGSSSSTSTSTSNAATAPALSGVRATLHEAADAMGPVSFDQAGVLAYLLTNVDELLQRVQEPQG